MANDLLTQIQKHLEFFGYSVTFEENSLKAEHNNKPVFWVINVGTGAFFRAIFTTNASAIAADRIGFLEFLDNANGIAVVARYRSFEMQLLVEAWYPPHYNQKSFGIFFEQYLADINEPAKRLQPLTDQFFRA